jgi:ParB family chromosome partitioning protein
MASIKKSRLGRGLGAIISGGSRAAPTQAAPPAPENAEQSPVSADPPAESAATQPPTSDSVATESNGLGYQEIAVAAVEPNPYQPRRVFNPEQIEELAESIRAEGLLQPIVVRWAGEKYQLIAGERRWRAFQTLGLKTIPARIVKAGNASAATMALIENLQREGLNPVDEAEGYASLIRDFDLTQDQVAQRVGKGRATVANVLRLLNLNGEIRGFLSTGMISPGHAKVLLGLETEQEQAVVARRVVADGLSVRATEGVVSHIQRKSGSRRGPKARVPAAESIAVADIEKRLGSFLNTRVALQHHKGKGKIVIDYSGNEDLQRILEKVGVGS